MRALFIQHDPGARPGLVGAALERRGYTIEPLPMSDSVDDASWTGSFPDPLDFDLVVPLGAVWSVYDRATVGDWIDAELELLRRADRHGVPVLGICFGGQALAAAHGGTVSPIATPEIGWRAIEPLDGRLLTPGPWMQWHSDRFAPPPGATELARNAVGPQAFRLRRNLALQFHPEVDEVIVSSWIEMGGDEALRQLEAANTSAEQVLADSREHGRRAATDVEQLLDRFLTEVAG